MESLGIGSKVAPLPGIKSFIKQKLKLWLTSNIDLQKVDNVIASTTFEKLKNLENKQGFNEKSSKMKKNFFNLGIQNKWQNILDENTIKILSTEFKEEMKELNYL